MDKLKNGSYSINNFLNQVQYSIKMEHNFVMRQPVNQSGGIVTSETGKSHLAVAYGIVGEKM